MQRRSLILLMAATIVVIVLAVAALATGGHDGGHSGIDRRALPGLQAGSATLPRSRYGVPVSI